jgi:N-acetylneuraminic acid mutarotase
METVAPMNTARSSFAMVVMADGRVLVSGGFNPMEGFQLLSCEIYDPVANTWTTTGNMDFQRDNHAGYLLADGQVLVTGGREYNGDLNLFQAIATAEVFDPTTDSWQTLSLPYGVNYHQMHEIAGAGIFTLGGADQTGDGVTTTYNQGMLFEEEFQSFSPVPEEWEDEGRYRYASCAMGDGTVVVTGGDDAEVGTAVRMGLVDQVNESVKASLQLFPNPAVDRVIVITKHANPQWQIVNMSGQLMNTGNGKIIEVNDLATGHYIVRITTPEGTTTKQLQVQR